MKRRPRLSLMLALVFTTLAFSLTTIQANDEAGFQPIFDGKTLKGWEGKPGFWTVEDGAITGRTTKENPTKGNTFLIWRDGELKDFELRLKFRIENHNSGIQYRSKDLGKFVVGGYQADFESGEKWTGILYEEKGRGILAKRGTKVVIDENGNKQVVGKTADSKAILDSIKKQGWNEYTIVAKGNHLVQKVNGLVTVDVTDKQASKAAKSGILALQLHAGPPMVVQFKDVRLKTLE